MYIYSQPIGRQQLGHMMEESFNDGSQKESLSLMTNHRLYLRHTNEVKCYSKEHSLSKTFKVSLSPTLYRRLQNPNFRGELALLLNALTRGTPNNVFCFLFLLRSVTGISINVYYQL